MSGPISKTFKVLVSTSNAEAVDLLVTTLDLDDERVRTLAVAALLDKQSTRGHAEVVRRFDALGAAAREIIAKKISRIGTSLRQCLLQGDAGLQQSALEIVRAQECYDQFSPLLNLLRDDPNTLQEQVADTIRELVDRLYEHCSFDKDSRANSRYLRNASGVRHEVLTALDHFCEKFDSCETLDGLGHAEQTVEWILVLGDPDNFAVKKVLTQSTPELRELAGNVLFSSKHAGVMQLVLDFISKNYPHRKTFETIERREDIEFICYLLRWLPKQPTEIQRRNFLQIESVAWLDRYDATLEIIPPGLQAKLVEFVLLLGLPEDRKNEIEQWIIRNGSPEGRLAAASLMATMDADTAQEIIFEGLDSQDAGIQAWATSQLRARGIPEAFSLLIEKLDSPLDAVRKTARDELRSFNLDCMLKIFEHLDPLVCLKAGELIQKIHPDCIAQLEIELLSPLRHCRVRAIQAAQAMGLHGKIVSSLRVIADDEDSLIRRIVAEMLGDISTSESVEILRRLRDDQSQRVREAASKSLENLQRLGLHDRAVESTAHGI